MLTINSEHPSSAYHFERKFQVNIYPHDKSFEKQEEELIEFNGKQQMESNMFSSENTKNEVLTITYEHPSSEDKFYRKFRAIGIIPFALKNNLVTSITKRHNKRRIQMFSTYHLVFWSSLGEPPKYA